ncbi:MAG TPA: NTP transferase domain-containing protein [Candidatus Binataceae bacterium]|nr:NTP transferase domain-containing protein [Candidatus Binataceae bacterium]
MPDGLSGAIIAAGRGERLRAASGGLPKPLVELGGKSLLLRQVEGLTRLGANPIHVIVNSETAALMGARQIRMPDQVQLIVADTPNSMESLLILGERIQSPRFLLSTVDAIVAEDELETFAAHAQLAMELRSLDGALGVVRWRGDHRPLFVETIADGAITHFGGEAAARVTAGIYLFTQRIFTYAAMAHARRLGALREFLGFLLEQRLRFIAIELKSAVDIDEAADLALARSIIASRATGESG